MTSQRVLAVAHQRPRRRPPRAPALSSAPRRNSGPSWTVATLRDEDRRAALLADDDVLDVLDALDEADAADEELEAVLLDDLGADVDVALADRLVDLGQRDAVGAELVRVDVDLVLLDEAADAGDLARRPRRP